jgi:hypothetical protein
VARRLGVPVSALFDVEPLDEDAVAAEGLRERPSGPEPEAGRLGVVKGAQPL